MKRKNIVYFFVAFFLFLLLGETRIYAESVNCYDGDLGYLYTSNRTSFKIFSSSASNIYVVIEETEYELTKDNSTNVWVGYVNGDLSGKEYTYKVKYNDVEYTNVLDPYGKFINSTNDKNVIVDVSTTTLENWSEDIEVEVSNNNEIIYGINVKNFSSDNSWNGISENKGKLLALQESGTKYGEMSTGYDYVANLGVSHLELSAINDNKSPFIVDSQYVTGTEVISKNTELKQVVYAYSQNNIGIIITFDFSKLSSAFLENLDKIDREYYLDENDQIDYSKPMTQKYIIDLLKYWSEEYKLEGINIKNLSSLNVELLNRIYSELTSIDSGILIYGDGSYSAANEETGGENNLSQLNISMINTSLNNALFGNLSSNENGILAGNYSKSKMESLKFAFLGGADNGQIDYSLVEGISYKASWGNRDTYQIINYLGSEDGISLYDKLTMNGLVSDNIIKQKMVLAFTTLMSANGIPYIYSGSEFMDSYIDTSHEDLTSIKGNNNFYYYTNKEYKNLNWSNVKYNKEMVNNFKSLVNYRKNNSSGNRLTSLSDLNDKISFYEEKTNEGIFGYYINYPNASTGYKEKVLTVFNYSANQLEIDGIDSDKKEVAYTYNGSKNDDGKVVLPSYSIYVEYSTKQPKINSIVALLLVSAIIGGIYIFNGYASKKLVEERGYDIGRIKKKYRPFINTKKEDKNDTKTQNQNNSNQVINNQEDKKE